MSIVLNIENFISDKITHRPKSLLNQDLIDFDEVLFKEIKGKNVLVIGGAGTIGSSFIRSLTKYQPSKLIIIDINENSLTELVRDCRSRIEIQLPVYFKTYAINFNDELFYKIFKKEGPFDIVANFAAHKHVRSEKDVFSIEAMIKNNVIIAKKFLDFLSQNPPKHFFCVSTDKAANPVNIMGASKKLMEEVILAYSDKFKITTARFANVAFSNGSLLAGFIDRVFKQQPLSCPADVERFFVSPQEAGEICLCACILGDSGDVFFPKLAKSTMVNFADIVEPFLKELGFELLICRTEEEAKLSVSEIAISKYPVYFFKSNTSGEKLYEEFYTENEELNFDKFCSLGIIKNAPRRSLNELEGIIMELEAFFQMDQIKKVDIVKLLSKMLPNFNHIETGISLDQKM